MLIDENCSKSQYLIVLSVDPLAKAKFWGLYSRQVTDWEGKVKFYSTFPVEMSHIFNGPSWDPDATHLLSGESYAHVIGPECSLKVNMF